MELKEAWGALRSGWWLVAAGLVLGAVLGLGVSLVLTPLYTSSTQLFVSSTGGATTTDVLQGSYFTQDRIASYAELVAGDELCRRVIARLDLDTTPTQLARQIDAAPVTDTVLLDIDVTDPSPARAKRIAQTIGDEFPRLIDDLEATDGAGLSPVRLAVSRPATTPTTQTSPQVARNIVLGALAGLVLGAAAALLRQRLDRTVKSSDEAAALTGAPSLGLVVRDAGLDARHVMDWTNPNRTAEDFRRLRTNLQFLNVDRPPKVIMVSSAVPSEGKTTVTINLAMALVASGRSVTVIEGDLRKPKVTRYLGLVGGVGLSNVLSGTANIGDVLQRYGSGGAYVVPAGPLPPNPSELLSSSQMAAVLAELSTRNDYVLLDAPPVLPVADAGALSVHVDGVLLVVRYGETRKDQLATAAASFNRLGVKVLGTILNLVPPRADLASAYGYGYDYQPDRASAR